jgi:C4-dicarboxylate-specific signal transduction histidine kinase
MSQELNKQNKETKLLNETLEDKVLEKTQELANFNKDLEIRVKEEVEKNRDKDLQILESAKMVSMGEMIGNIAHQWRQPLSAISTLSTSIIAQKEFGIYDDNDLIKNMNSINDSSQYLSETINAFRDFLKDKKELKEQVLQDNIKSAIGIVGTVLKDVNIDFKDNVDYSNPILITIVSGELPQVIINIINNAKDALKENNVANPLIEIDLVIKNDIVIITIQDNGGGVPEKVLPKIFDPYFTTKHQSQGTGLGLHMSHKIITESMKGELYVKNMNDGAKFFIELPLSN